jgi:hypothetical protein
MTGVKNSGKGGAMKHASLALILPLVLAACGADAPTPRLDCPNVNVLEQTSTLTQFLPGRQDAGAEITTAHITGVAGSCDLVKPGVLKVTFQAGFSASNGPANQGHTLKLPYFVALTQGDTIISKTLDTMEIPFDGNVSTAAVTGKSITLEVPNANGSARSEILVGFQLTPQQLSYAARP